MTKYDRIDTYDVCCNTPNCYLEFGADWSIQTVEELLEMWNRRDYETRS